MSSSDDQSTPTPIGPKIARMMKILGQIWKKEKLTKEGWYWYRARPGADPSIERVVRKGRKLTVLESGPDGREKVPLYIGEWAGPLEPPEG